MNIRKISSRYCPVTQNYVTDLKELAKAIEEDTAQGFVPFMYFATVGSTASCAKDDIEGLSGIISKHNLFLAVDCAYLGSSFIV